MQAGDLLLLSGTLGAGKTCLVRGIASGLGNTEPVASPTFALIQEYRSTEVGFAHADLYRLPASSDPRDIGLDDYLDGRWIVAVEWADRFPSVWPAARLDVSLDVRGEQERGITLTPRGQSWESRLAAWRSTLVRDPDFQTR